VTDERRDQTIERLDALIARLEQPLSEGEDRNGWTDSLRLRWRDYFASIRVVVARGDNPEAPLSHIVPWLTRDGIEVASSPLAAAITDAQTTINEALT
jgi:hypothetical protein